MGWEKGLAQAQADMEFLYAMETRREMLVEFFSWLTLPMRIFEGKVRISTQLLLHEDSGLDFVICPKTGRYVELGAGG